MRKQETTDYHALSADEALARLETGPDGLDEAAVEARRREYGENRLPEARRRGRLALFLAQFNNLLIHILIVAGVITLLLQHWVDSAVILGVVFVNAVIGFVQEGRAEQAMTSIRRMLVTRTRVRRGGELHELDAVELVPGDIVLLEGGDRVPADLRLIRARGLRVDESGLTGESVPVDKNSESTPAETVLADRTGMAWSGTLVTSGQGLGVVVATGRASELGRISEAAEAAGSLVTPLLQKIKHFGRQLTIIILGLALFSFLVGTLLRGQAWSEMFLAAVGLAVAAIPEGLPAVITITLALGVQAMGRQQAIVRRLPAVETLGSVTVICSDKTGTLTRNEMTVRGLRTEASRYSVTGSGYAVEGGVTKETGPPADKALSELILAGLLCNDASIRDGREGRQITGDPMEAALTVLAEKNGLVPAAAARDWPRRDSIPFEAERRYMASLHHDHRGHGHILVKGAPELILSLCETVLGPDGQPTPVDAADWEASLAEFAARGYRTLAFATKACETDKLVLDERDVEQGLSLLGLVGLEDPPRPEAIDAVRDCRRAGIRVKMITGDHLGTALAIGRQMGIGDGHTGMSGIEFQQLPESALITAADGVDVFARFSPEDKLSLVGALKQAGEITAMTGDGVNDAPALRRADVGVAMGGKGTETAREAAEIVLADDNFATIAGAVRIGRAVYDNIRKSLLFILPTNGGEALLILTAVMLGLALPATPVQILWVNMVTAVTLALALVFEPAENDVMERPPRPPGEAILTAYLIWRIAFVSVLMLAAAFWIFHWHITDGRGIDTARTAAVNTVVACEIFYLLACRYLSRPALSLQGLAGNPWVPAAIILVIALQMAFTYAPPMQVLFQTTALNLTSWAWIGILSLPVLLAVELEKALLRRWRPSAGPTSQ